MGIFTKGAADQAATLIQAAEEAYAAGDGVHLCTFAGPSKMSGLTASDASGILSGIAEAGWRPINCSFLWIDHVGATGHYLFERKETP